VVDGDGLGAGVCDQLTHRNYGRNLHEFHGGANAADGQQYFNKRAEYWGLLLDWLKAGGEIPNDSELANDLTTPGFDHAHGNRFHGSIILESKRSIPVCRGQFSTVSTFSDGLSFVKCCVSFFTKAKTLIAVNFGRVERQVVISVRPFAQ
jgi:hypothetical protein